MMLKDHKGKWSSKRVMGAILLVVCVFFAFVDLFTDYKANEIIFGTLFGGALALLGAETVVNGFSKRHNQRQRSDKVK